ncbi:MAG TPA: hypothetical protein VFV05_26030 [Methylomirabilota bacterium]|nr:hypothetical protein [Methylomirabilota bacterium]
MRLMFWGLVVVAICYGAYSGMIAVWQWIAVNNAVDEIISREGAEALPPPELKSRVMQATNEAGVPLDERSVTVIRDDRGVQVEINWTMPVIIVRGDTVLAVPLSVKRGSRAGAR